MTLPNTYSLCRETLSNIFIEEQDVLDIISILRVNKDIGPDLVSHKMLKSTLFTVSKTLAMLFNRSLADKTFPYFCNSFFKKNDPSLVSNYKTGIFVVLCY